ncbi:MAG: metalloregulator ArsR/SmtB family transcription factor [Caldilineae bacterium]|nr:metalloregulator ArsR/SmtB family transcription factor [Caldilineae bacterium]
MTFEAETRDVGPMQRTLALIKAASDVNRLRILRLVDRMELSVGDLAELTGLSQPSVSRHLAVLRGSGAVQERRVGARTLSRAASELPEPADQLLAVLRSTCSAPDFGFDADLAALERLRSRRSDDRTARFDRLAGNWDALRSALLGESLSPAEVCSLLVAPGQRWIDVGAGTGLLLPWLSALAGPDGEVLAVEASQRMVDVARGRVAELSLSNVRVQQGDMSCLPAPDAWAEGLIFSLSLGHAEDLDVALGEAARVLAPGARLAIADLLPHDDRDLIDALGQGFQGIDPQALAMRLASAGFDRVRRIAPSPAERPSRSEEADRDALPRLEALRMVARRSPDGASIGDATSGRARPR